MLRFRRWGAWLCGAIIAAGTLYFVSALLLGLVPSRTEIITPAGDYTFHACDNGVHVDLVLPVVGGGRDWFDYFPARDFAGDVTAASHVVLGWGARGFFATTPEWRDIRPMPVLRALFWWDDSVLHVGYAGDPMGRANCRALTADAAGVARLFRFIDQSLDLTQGPPRQALAGYGLADAFYVATGRYSLFRTCNVWSAEALQESGQPMAIWSPFSFQIMRRLDAR